jgi:hypothetical protein
MPIPHQPFGPAFVLGGMLNDRALKLRFEVWSRHPGLPKIIVKRLFNQWKINSPDGANALKNNQTVRVRYYG